MQITIDRFEGDFAVAELTTGDMVICPRKIFPEEAKEGDVISICIEKKATADERHKIQSRMDKLFND